MGDYEIKGAEQFGALARRLKEAGDKELRSELYRGINRATKPMKQDIKSHVGDYMPSRYAAILAKGLRLTVSRRANKSTPGITLKGRAKGKSAGREVGRVDRGVLQHPLFGMRGHWFANAIKPGFFTEQAKKGAKEARAGILQAMNDVAEKVAKK